MEVISVVMAVVEVPASRDLRDHPDPDPVGFGIPNRVSPGSGSGRVQSLRDGIGTGFKILETGSRFLSTRRTFFCFLRKICSESDFRR